MQYLYYCGTTHTELLTLVFKNYFLTVIVRGFMAVLYTSKVLSIESVKLSTFFFIFQK